MSEPRFGGACTGKDGACSVHIGKHQKPAKVATHPTTCPTCGSDRPVVRHIVRGFFSRRDDRMCDNAAFHDRQPAPNPGMTHFVGDDCEGGHRAEQPCDHGINPPYTQTCDECGPDTPPAPERTGETVDAEKALADAHYYVAAHLNEPACSVVQRTINRLARAAFEAGQRHIRDTERAVSQGWIGVGGFLSEPKWLPKEEEPR